MINPEIIIIRFLVTYSFPFMVALAVPMPARAIGMTVHNPQKSSRIFKYIEYLRMRVKRIGLITFPDLSRDDIVSLILAIL